MAIRIIVIDDGATPERPSGPPPASPFSGTSVTRLESLACHYRDLIASNVPHPPSWYSRQTLAEIEVDLAWKRQRGARAEAIGTLRVLLAEVAS